MTRIFLYPGPTIALTCGVLASCGNPDTSQLPTEAVPVTESSVVAAAPLSFRQISTGGDGTTCSVTTDDRAFCWGTGYFGNGAPKSQSLRPVPAAGELRFRQISSGYDHICGVTTDNQGYCWGNNVSGQLGDGTFTDRLSPVRVAGNLQFRQISAGATHTCGVTPENRIYCWGVNSQGQLGDGTTAFRTRPTVIAGGRLYRQVDVGFSHTCAVNTENRVYCWGDNRSGQVGDGTTATQRLTPVPVSRRFRQMNAGFDHTCAVTTPDNRAFCWGGSRSGQIGDGNTPRLRREPRLVAGGLAVSRVSAGSFSTCAETTSDAAYCWGSNTYGQVGDGTALNNRLKPVAVKGGHKFAQVSAGSEYACGVTTAGAGYCWGHNFGGELGDGTRTDRHVPVRVSEPM